MPVGTYPGLYRPPISVSSTTTLFGTARVTAPLEPVTDLGTGTLEGARGTGRVLTWHCTSGEDPITSGPEGQGEAMLPLTVASLLGAASPRSSQISTSTVTASPTVAYSCCQRDGSAARSKSAV